jgi:hypothetical protein
LPCICLPSQPDDYEPDRAALITPAAMFLIAPAG